MSNPYGTAAEAYWRAGWANPIPVTGKWPPPHGYTGYGGRQVSYPDLCAWREGPEAAHNIALRLPGDVVGIDVDAHDGKVGYESLRKAIESLGALPASPLSTSRPLDDGSGIQFYRVPPDVNLRGAERRFRTRFGDHVDIIRRDHRYAMVWPSVHPDTGTVYQWYDTDGQPCEIPRPADLPALPSMWVDFLAAPSDAPPAVTVVDGPSPWDGFPRQFTRDQAEGFVQPFFTALRVAPVGTINNRLNDAAMALGHFVPAFWTHAEAEHWLLDALDSTAYDGRTWRAETTIASALGAKTWRAELLEDTVPDSPDSIRAAFPRLVWRDLWADTFEEEWIIEPLLPARRLVALYSAPKVGKSLLMLELAAGIAMGQQSLLGQDGTPPARRVLYVDFENDPRADIRTRLQDMGHGPDDLDGLVYLSFPSLAALDSQAGGQQLVAAVEAYGCEVVVIDTVSRAIKGEENDNDTWLAFYRHTGKELKARGIALVRLDHTGKDASKGQRGGSAKSGDVDAVWRMSEVRSDRVYRLECEAHRMPVTEKTLVLHRERGPLRHRVDAAGRYAAWSESMKEALSILEREGVPRDAGRDKCRDALRAAGHRIGNSLLAEVLRQRKEIDDDERGLSGTGPGA